MQQLRPRDLAREHGISTQAVRNYEKAGFLPPAERTNSGYRIYTARHAAALRCYLALVSAYGHQLGGQIMIALHTDDLDMALAHIDRGHAQLLSDRDTLEQVAEAVRRLTSGPEALAVHADPAILSIGALARRLRISPATLRSWERAGVLAPARDPSTGYRRFGADDIRDAELAHLLRRGGFLLGAIATVASQIRMAGGTDELAMALSDWRRHLRVRGLAMLTAAARLGDYLREREAARECDESVSELHPG